MRFAAGGDGPSAGRHIPLAERCERHPHDGFTLAEPMRVSRRSERALLSVANALLPPPPAPRSPELDERVTSHARVMLQYMPRVTALALLFFVRVLDWAPVWRFVALKRLRSLSPARASAVLSGIANSRWLLVRLLLQGPKALVLTTYFDQDEVHRALDYEPKGFLRESIARRDTLLRVLDETPRLHALDETHGYQHPKDEPRGEHWPSEPSPQPSPGRRGGPESRSTRMILRYEDYARERTFDADVVVVGTGAGGAVVGAELAEAGYDVLFVEEGAHHGTPSFNPYVTESVPRLYRDVGASVIAGVPPIPYIEGRSVGGSTTINGGMTWRAPEKVLAGWQKKSGLSELSLVGLEPYFERAERDISVRAQSAESIGKDSELMREGAEKLGWSYVHNLRNQHGCVGANNCGLGCPTGAKQSTLVSYMPRAFAHGARCLTEVRVDRLLIEHGRCVGVEGTSVDRRTRGDARRLRMRGGAVVIACGAVQTPLLLQAHKLGRPSKLLGQNFTCHPNVKVLAVYPFEVRGYRGVSQAGQIREFEARGMKMAENMIPPGALACQVPFHGSEAFELFRDYNRMALTGVMIEDSTSGVVKRAPFGLGGPRYAITGYDHERLVEGVKHLSELHFAMGASKVVLPFAHMHLAHSVDDLKKLDVRTIKKSTLDMFTVHLMGTAQMGSRADRSVVDATGQLWDLPGCYVADASLFPSYSAVNPQLSIMALAMLVASRVRIARRRTRVGLEVADAAE